MDYVFHIVVMIEIFAILAISFNLAAGYGGLLSLATAAFYGLGAYTSALVTSRVGIPFLIGIPISMAIGALASLAVSLPSARLHDDYLLMVTFSFQMIVFTILNNWIDLTGGPSGIPGIPQPSILGLSVTSPFSFSLLGAAQALFVYMIVARLINRPIGRVLRAIREDELFAQSVGKDTLRVKITIIAVSAALAASAGSLFASYASYIDPTSFTILDSIFILSIVIIGGSGTLIGPIVGAVALVVMPEVFRLVGLPQYIAGDLRQILYGAALVLLMIFKPQGLVGQYDYTRPLR
jgi:branched-chain amino acid transport system permease protein